MSCNCSSCGHSMTLRNGKFGEFYFCPNQSWCGGKTVTAINVDGTGNPTVDILLSLIPNYTKDEIEQMYFEDERKAELGIFDDWYDVWI